MSLETASAPWSPISMLKRFIEAPVTQMFIMGVIIFNAAILGLETSSTVMAEVGGQLRLLDTICMAIFVAELTIKLIVYRFAFFREPWNVFDFIVVTVTLAPAGQGLSVLRALRILRALRLISMVPKMKKVVQALLHAIPGMASIIALLSLVFYVCAVMATKLFGPLHPDWFGTIGESLFTLFQIMTLESWAMGVVRPVMVSYPYAWLFFVPFILITTFAVLNLFIAIIVNAMEEVHEEEEQALQQLDEGHGDITMEIRALRREVERLSEKLDRVD